jgi:glutamate-1-semialdehyde aminotransferase
VLEKSREYWNPGKTDFWVEAGVPLVIDRREEYFIYDMSGKRLLDVHLNGGTYNLGHRNPEVVAARHRRDVALRHRQHHFPAVTRTALAEALVSTAPKGLTKVIYGSWRRRGHRHRSEDRPAHHHADARSSRSPRRTTGTPGSRSAPATTVSASCSRRPADEFVQVPFNDLGAMEQVLREREPAAVIMETIPAPTASRSRARLPGGRQEAVRAVRRALHRRRGADRPDADR